MLLKKGSNKRLSSNLVQNEIDCKCNNVECHFTLVDPKLIFAFQNLRNVWGSAIKITSGFRCQSHNKSVGGVNFSLHTKGQAIDLVPLNGNLTEFEKLARLIFPFVKKYDDLGFVHCDTRGL